VIMPPIEHWKAIVDSEDYEVSNLGRVRNRRTGAIKEPTETSRGLVVNLYANRRTNVRKLHSIVANAFLGTRLPSQMVWHKDGDQSNCAAANLVYISLSEHFRRLASECDITTYRSGKLTPTKAAQIRARALRGEPVHLLAAEYGVSSPLVSNIKLGRKWHPTSGLGNDRTSADWSLLDADQ
jgi:hypothetical protein